jgi:alkanesulfonate monooxygenase SsuD/methylene tetrahydromethanopterin reductase-like flavin-dependent oxidoreductase (luciferase family)
MKVGYAYICQNPLNQTTDYACHKAERSLAELAEPLGFDSFWSVEHHFTDYTMVPDVLQLLSYIAGRTRTIELGSMVVVLPWHDPMRVAEEVSLLDNMSDGRFVLGIGRGAGRVEFEGFRTDMGESRERFVEYAEMLLTGLENGYCEYDGKFVKQPRKDIRPAPFKSFRGRTYAAAVSPESARIMAKLGVGILIIPQKPWEAVAAELGEYRKIYREVNGAEAPPPIAAGWCLCDQDAGRAEEKARRWINGYWETAMRHYEFRGEHWAKTKGYEYYAAIGAAPRTPEMDDFFLNLQIWGTPEQCYNRVMKIRETVGQDHFVGVFSYAGMPYDEAEQSLRLFAREVAPELKKVGVTTRAAAAS